MDKLSISRFRHDIQGELAAISAGVNILLSETEISAEDGPPIRAQIDHRLERLKILIEEVFPLPKQL